MFVSVFGVETRYSEWLTYLLGCFLDCKYGSHFDIFANTLEQLRDAWDRRDGSAVILRTDWPRADFSNFLIDSGFPVVAVIEDPLSAVLAGFPHKNLADAIRTTSGFLSTLCPAFRDDRSIRIGTHFLHEPVEALLHALSFGLFGEADHKIIDAVKARLAPYEPGTMTQQLVDRDYVVKKEIDFPMREPTPEQIKIADALTEPFRQLLEDGIMRYSEWPLELFECDTPGDELCGGARKILFGPCLHLPTGRWRLTIRYETSGNFSGNDLGAEIWSPRGTKVAEGMHSLPIQGMFEFSLDFDMADPTDCVDLVLYLPKGAIEGKFRMRRVSVECLSHYSTNELRVEITSRNYT